MHGKWIKNYMHRLAAYCYIFGLEVDRVDVVVEILSAIILHPRRGDRRMAETKLITLAARGGF